MKQIKYLFTANETKSLPAVGSYIYLKAATGEILVKTDNDESAFMTAGDFVRMDRPFTNLVLEDLSGAGNQITIVTSDDGEAGKWGNVNVATPGSLVTKADVTLTAATKVSILAANANRKEALIQVSTACRIGDTNTGAARGVSVAAGGTIILESTAEIFGYSVPAGVATVTETET